MQADDDNKEEKLKAALWYAVGQTVDSIALSQDFNADSKFIGGLSEMMWGQIEHAAQDLEAFAKHRGRTTIGSKDVVLLGRHNDGLNQLLQSEADKARGT